MTTHIVLFSPDRDTVEEEANTISRLCDKKGVEYNGPSPEPLIRDWRPAADDEPPYIINRRELDESETQRLLSKTIHTRSLKLHQYGSDDVVRRIALRDYPEDLFMTIAVNKPEFQSGTSGYAPHTYDPQADYKTEL